jgi:serine/threonine-protein kinase HipA
MFALVRGYMTARDINHLLDAVIFNVAIGNVDSHAKNYSILLGATRTELAPLYDLMSGLAWPNITQNHAQDIGGQQRGRHIYRRHWRRMAEACGLAGPATVRRVRDVTARILRELPAAAQGVAAMPAGGARLKEFVRTIGDRARIVGENAMREGDAGPDPEPEATSGATTYGDA